MKNHVSAFIVVLIQLITITSAGQTVSLNVLENRGDTIFMVVEKMPKYPGGEQEMLTFILSNIVYPVDAYLNIIEGRVFIEFIVDTAGNLRDIKVIRGIGYGCDEEAMRVINLMPAWDPGEQRGKPVNVKFSLPITYKISEEAKQQILESRKLFKEASKDARQYKFRTALDLLDRAIVLVPEYVDALMLRADIYLQEYEIEKACIDWKMIRELGKADADAFIDKYCIKK